MDAEGGRRYHVACHDDVRWLAEVSVLVVLTLCAEGEKGDYRQSQHSNTGQVRTAAFTFMWQGKKVWRCK